MIRYYLVILFFVCLSLTNLFALKLVVFPQRAPLGGLNLSKGVVVVHETGEILSLSSEGQCIIDVSPENEQITIDVFVPGFQVAGGTFDSEGTVKMQLISKALQEKRWYLI